MLQRRVAAFRPDAVLGHYGTFPLLAELHAVGIPAYYYVHDAWSVRGLDRYRESIRPIASSPFVASEIRRVAGLDAPLVLPAIDLDACRIQGVRERGTVTFINPVPKKGVEIAIEVARRMPDVPFLFVEGGWFRHARRPAVRRVARRADRVPNITRQSFESDVRKIYARTDVLIVPSPSESFPRVVIEAQSNGIPVIGARVAGLPQTIRDGGRLVDDREDVDAWVEAIRSVREDESLYQRLSRNARERAADPELDADRLVDRFLEVLRDGRNASRAAEAPELRVDLRAPTGTARPGSG